MEKKKNWAKIKKQLSTLKQIMIICQDCQITEFH